MSDRIIVETDGAAPAAHSIEQPVIRIGSAESCDIVVPCFPTHLLTVQYDRNQYEIINRGAGPLRLGKRLLAPQASAVWRPHERLTAGPVQLVLQTGRDVGAARRERTGREGASAAGEEGARPGRKKPPRRWERVLIPVLLLTAWLILCGPSKPTGGTRGDFNRLAVQLYELRGRDLRTDRIRLMLQHARNLELRGASHQAVTVYREIRDVVAGSETARNAQEQQVLAFVKARLSALAQ